VNNVKILFQDELEQLKIVRRIVKTMEEAEKLAVCLNHWSDDDSWGGTFRYNDIIAEDLYKDWFVNMKMLEQLVVDEDGVIQGYISFDHHGVDHDAAYVPLLGVCPTAQGKGFGKALLLSILKKTIELGKRRLELDTWAGNLRSVPVYKKTGFFWRKNTSAIMENYLPAVLTTPFFKEYFSKNDFYNSREFKVTQKQDDFTYKTMQAYFYQFVEDESNNLTVYVDCHAKDLSGFTYLKNGKKLSLQLIPNQNEIFLGLDEANAELVINNEWKNLVHIKGNINGYKGIKDLSPREINLIIEPGEEKTIKIDISVDLSVEAYFPHQEPRKRTKCRISAYLEIDGNLCQLGCGWVPKDVIQITLLKESLYFGKNAEKLLVPLGFRNLTQTTINGELSITGEGLSNPFLLDFNLDAESAMEVPIPIQAPVKDIVESWEWKLEFKVKRETIFKILPLITTHLSCFTKSGVVAYINSKPEKEAIIENEFLRFHFSADPTNWYSLRRIFVKDMDLELRIFAYGISIGRPFPEASTEFNLIDSPFKIVQREKGIALKQEFISKIEKPGLKVVRWIELDAGKKFVTSYYELTNTNNNKILTNVSIRNVFFRWNAIIGRVIIPGKQGLIVVEDPEFIDEYDFPQKKEDYIEPWIACEPYNAEKIGFGVIWEQSELEKILTSPEYGPNIETIAYDIKPNETIRTGHYTLVIGEPTVRLTRKIWLEEFNGKAILNTHRLVWSEKLLDFDIGQKFHIPGSNQKFFPSLSLIDLDSDKLEFRANYLAKRKSSINIEALLLSELWSESQLIKFKLEEGIQNRTNILINKKIDKQKPYLIPIKGKISLPLNSRTYNWIGVPYHSGSRVKLEKSSDHWIFSNDLLKFKTSNSHGASLFGGTIGDNEELLFSRFPNKEAYVWYKFFVGGLHPIAWVSRDSNSFFNNIWIEPQLTEKNGWFGLKSSLASASNDIRLKELSFTVTYYMRPRSPLVWGSFSFTNNSKMTNTIQAGFNLFLQPIERIYHRWKDGFFIGKHTGQQRDVYTEDNWVIVDWGKNREKALFGTAIPQINIRGEYSNKNNYAVIYSNGYFTLKPGETKRNDVILVFSKDLDILKSFQQKQHVVKL
jgi:GNAT superfamily N-acetyltransferase